MSIYPIPSVIGKFIEAHHVVSLACYAEQTLWCANCFYCYDSQNARLIILTKTTTLHGQLMLRNPQVVGTITAQAETLNDIEGIQFHATASLLVDEQAKQALNCYYQRHAIAKFIPSEVWSLTLTMIKHTSNKHYFAQKTVWQRTD